MWACGLGNLKRKGNQMKMTREQKSFFEYGKAIERMNASKKRLRGIWRSSENIRKRIGKAQIIAPRHRHNVLEAWQKRALCRAWLPPEERECINCKHDKLLRNQYPCSHCFPGEWENLLWEPRKEGE